MHSTIQSVISAAPKVTQKIAKRFLLNLSMILHTPGQKNYASMARACNVSYNQAYIASKCADEYIDYAKKFLINLINQVATKENNGHVLIDFTVVAKPFSQCIPDVTYDYDGSRKCVEKGLSLGFAVWSNGKVCIPLTFETWLRKKDIGNSYKTKIDLAKELIAFAKGIIPFSEVMLDGAFVSEEMLKFLDEQKSYFTIRIPCNRVITINNESFQLRHCPKLKFKRNEKFKTVCAFYKGFKCYFTAHKRKTKNGGSEIVFIISNIKRAPKEHVIAYKKRWPQEKFHRTAKQKLGLGDCQSTMRNKQHAHIFLVMHTYAILELMKIAKKKKSVEDILHKLRCQKSGQSTCEFTDLEETFMA